MNLRSLAQATVALSRVGRRLAGLALVSTLLAGPALVAGNAYAGTATTASASGVTQQDIAAFFEWAPRSYPSLFGGSYTAGTIQGYQYRYYPASGHYLAVKDGGVYVLGPITEGEVMFITSVYSLLCDVYAPNCSASTTSSTSSQYTTSGSVHRMIWTWGVGTYTGAVSFFRHNSNGTAGELINRTTDACRWQTDSNGNVGVDLYPNDPALSGFINYRYEDNYGATNTDGAQKLSLFLTEAPNKYIEYTHDGGVRIVDTASAVEMVCATAADSDRFPAVDGRLGAYSGTYKASNAVEVIMAPDPTIYKGKTCDAVINSAGQVLVTAGGYQLPMFYTTDREMDQSIISTMFTGNPLLAKEKTFALSYNTKGFNGEFTLYLPPLTYFDSGSPSVSSETMITCRTLRQ